MKLFWRELKQADRPQKCHFGRGTVWASLDKVEVDTARLEQLFESKAKELCVTKVTMGVGEEAVSLRSMSRRRSCSPGFRFC